MKKQIFCLLGVAIVTIGSLTACDLREKEQGNLPLSSQTESIRQSDEEKSVSDPTNGLSEVQSSGTSSTQKIPENDRKHSDSQMWEEPPLSDQVKNIPVPDFLTEEQKSLYLHAREAMNFLIFETWSIETYPLLNGESVPNGERAQPVQINDTDYNLAMGRYREWNFFQNSMLTLFKPEYFDSLINKGISPRFISIDGRLGFVESSRGANIMAKPELDSFEVTFQSKSEIQFKLIGHYLKEVPNESEEDWMERKASEKFDYTKSYPIEMVFTDSGWRISAFAVSN